MKRKVPALAILILLFTLLTAVSAQASFRVQYSRNGQEATESTADSVQIVSVAMEYGDPCLIDGSYCYPSTYGNLPVTGLLSGACDGLWSSITSITLPSSLTRFNVTDVPGHIEKIVFPDAFDNTTADQVVRYSYPQLTGGYDRYYANAGTKTAQELRAAGIAFRDIGTGQWISQNVYSYTLADGMATLTTYTGSLEYINVPHMIDNQYPVVAIGNNLYKNRTSIKSVFIPDGVLSIGDNAFAGCTSLTEVTMNCMCDNLGAGAFSGCTSLKTVHIPESAPVTEIKSGTFAQCSKLSGVYYIPASVTAIRENAFAGCTALKNVYIPWRTTEIADSAFDTRTPSEGYSMSGYTGTAAEAYALSHGYSFSSSGTLLTVSFDPGHGGQGQMDPIRVPRYTTVTLPECAFTNEYGYRFVHWVSGNAIYDSGASFIVKEDVCFTAIWNSNCGVMVYEPVSADSNYYRHYYSLYYNDPFVFPQPVTAPPDGCSMLYWDCGSKQYRPGEYMVVCSDYTFAPDWIKALPDSIQWSVTDGVLNIRGSGAIDSCAGTFGVVGGIYLPWFEHRNEITSIVIGEGITGIGRNAFIKMNNVESISLPSTIAPDSVPFGQFSFTVIVDGNNPYMVSSGNFVRERQTNRLIHCSETGSTITVPDGTAILGSGVFSRASFGSMKTLNIPASVTEIEAASITNTSLRTVNYGGTKAQWDAVQLGEGNTGLVNAKIVTADQTILPKCGENVTWELNGQTLTLAGTGPMYDYDTPSNPPPWINESITSLVIPDGITTIGDHAFENTRIVRLELPGSVIRIGSSAFEDCNALEDIFFSEGLKTIGDHAFSGCGEYHVLDIPDGVTAIGDKAFHWCSFLSILRLPASLDSIGSEAFDHHVYPLSVTYAGTQKQWLQVSLHKNHDWLENAVITYQQQDVEVESFGFAESAPSVTAGETLALTIANKVPEEAILVLTWTSSDETILTVDGSGTVTGVAPGTATVTATDLGGKYAQVSVSVLRSNIYTVTVMNGEGSDEYEAGAIVTIKANDPEDGKRFKSWASEDGVCFTDAAAMETTFTMPEQDVIVTATYEDICLVTVVNGTLGNGETVGYYTADETVTIRADEPEAGKQFVKWEITSGDISIADETQAETSFTMGSEAVTVTATYEDIPAPTTYTVTVMNGTGSGEYEAGAPVTIKANDPDEGKQFKEWTTTDEGVNFANASAAETTFTMPEHNVTVTATYEDIPAPAKYSVTVVNGTGNGDYEAGATVTITANAPDEGKQFKEWTTDDGVDFANATNTETTFAMPEHNVTVTATYKDAGDPGTVTWTVTFDSNGGSAVENKTVNDGDKVAKPADPTYEGHTFSGWYKEGEDNPFDFEIPITANITLTAHWTEQQQQQDPDPDPQPQPTGPQAGSYSDSTGKYDVSADGTATYKGPAKDQATVTIPATIKVNGFDVPVTKIADKAFKGKKKLKTITIGANIREIGTSAFEGCKKLKTVKGGANVEKIGAKAFKGCVALTKYTIGTKVNFIGKSAFYGCTKLKTITVKSTLLTKSNVKSGAFKKINAKATFKVPKSKKKEYAKWLPKKGTKTVKVK